MNNLFRDMCAIIEVNIHIFSAYMFKYALYINVLYAHNHIKIILQNFRQNILLYNIMHVIEYNNALNV